MSKRFVVSVVAALALVATALPAGAQEAPEEEPKETKVPELVQVSDPGGDANYQANDWQTGNVVDGADILKVWFSNDPGTISVHIQTATPPAGDVALMHRVRVNPNNALSATAGCILLEGTIPGGTNVASSETADMTDSCGEEAITAVGEIALSEGPEGSSIVTLTFGRDVSPNFGKQSILFTPISEIYQLTGAANGGLLRVIDNTKPGSDYTVKGKVVAPKKEEPEGEEGEEGEEEPEEEPEEEEPESTPEPKKGKKKKGKKGCAPWVPGEMGAEAETTVVTEAATAEKPVEVPITAPAGLPVVAQASVFHNIQVDTAAGEKGLFVRYEFPAHEDLDLYLHDAAGEEVASAAGFNPAPYVPGETDGTGNGGHSEMGAEQIDGLPTADCVGYTADLASFLTQGGEFTLKLWLADPEAAEE